MIRYLYTMTAVGLAVFYGAVVVTGNALLRLLGGVEIDLATRRGWGWWWWRGRFGGCIGGGCAGNLTRR